MEKEELEALLDDPKKLVDAVTDLAPEIPDDAENFEPEQHRVVTDKQYRPDRQVDVATGQKDPAGNEIYRKETKAVHRIPSATQKLIIDWSVDLALSAGIGIDCTPREGNATDEIMLAMVKKTLEDNKFDYLAMEIERIKQRFLTVLLVWYSVPAEPGYWDDIIPGGSSRFKMRCTIMSPEDGDVIIPLRDQYKDMIGAARKYIVKIDGQKVNKMDLFLSDKYMTFIESETGWALEKSTPIPYGKANFILDEQKRTEWADVAAKIERIEKIDSDSADENEISAFPILVATGEIVAASGGGASNTRKTFQMAGEKADLKYVESKGGQESASNERKNIRTDIFTETATPDLKFEDISGDLPGVTIEMMLLPSTNKAKRKHKGSIGMFHQRNFNFLKSAMSIINVNVKPSLSLVIKPKFSIDLPKNRTEDFDNAVKLYEARLISMKTAINMLGTVTDIDAEIKAIEEEVAKRAALAPKPVAPVAQ
ncbi:MULTISPECIES: phage portal protein [unclassified Pedobacter]|uniref:phage portal protein n=1 Tax=unclassified Pedobacter TaxID=2628915 RepID=UPI001423D310|nr:MULTISPECIES: phage portal protein [unclassified Pedobacter]NII81725.1 SPP1 family phage portal protein [Pedobacter sp. SG908]NMN35729.1 SPP1 family phage portal protein [Pedobacter sp. SG918]